jgi:MFS superfamily sulfate permease-like transporter
VCARFSGPLCFGSAADLRERFARIETERPDQRRTILVLRGISGVDVTAAWLLARAW